MFIDQFYIAYTAHAQHISCTRFGTDDGCCRSIFLGRAVQTSPIDSFLGGPLSTCTKKKKRNLTCIENEKVSIHNPNHILLLQRLGVLNHPVPGVFPLLELLVQVISSTLPGHEFHPNNPCIAVDAL